MLIKQILKPIDN